MTVEIPEQWPVTLIYFFLSCAGFGIAENRSQRRILNISLAIFITMCAVAMYVMSMNLLYNIREGSDSQEILTILFSTVIAALVTFKLISFLTRRTAYEGLLLITREKLWRNSWTDYGILVLEKCGHQAKVFLFAFVIIGHICGATFILEPIYLMRNENITSASHRRLPFEIRIGLPGHETPYYELFFFIDAFGIYIVTILYFCFDYYLVLVNIFIVGQFDILKDRFEDIYRNRREKISGDGMGSALMEFKQCVMQHQFLIKLVNDVESLYKIMNLFQLLVYSFVICMVSYQLLTATNAFFVFKFASFGTGNLLQLFAITLTCHNIKIASEEVAVGIYRSSWYHENFSKKGRELSRNFLLVFMKTQYPCYLSGCGFFPITLDTLKSIITTAFSYLTLIRESMK
ncbi:odorant receptor Or2-like isoform X1 [Fopius arisanus]|uniref:Odorant receptor n=1 Tax=Fopius arisanus TaxID=64838 RepID=A0A9R1T650_9HYME|nr:PREDICTED: odorant receptor Or2-like isoform X1 [Fopius arisanus]